MFFINLKIAIRSLFQSRVYTIVSISSLVLGFIGFIFMLFYANYESSYDKWIPDYSSIYRIDQRQDPKFHLSGNTPGPLANHVQNELPEIKYATALQKFNLGMPFYHGSNNAYTFKNFYGVDSAFLKIFPIRLKYGSFADFYKPQKIIISNKVCRSFFGEINPVGQTISLGYNTKMDFMIAGVLEDFPGPSHLDIEAISWYPQNMVPDQDWSTSSVISYIKVNQNISTVLLSKKIKNIYQNNIQENKNLLDITLEPIHKIHVSSLLGEGENMKLLVVVILLSSLLLIISCINFTNLIIAKCVSRNKEIAIKKLLGTDRISLIKQFLSETLLQAMLAFLIAVGLLAFLMPYLKYILGIEGQIISSLTIVKLIIQLLSVILLVSIVTGLYPALIISGKKISNILKGGFSLEKGKDKFRSVLLVVQFTMAICFIICLIFINKQIEFMKNKNLGFDPYKVVKISTFKFYSTPFDFEQDKTKLLEVRNVENATVTSDVPGNKLQNLIKTGVGGNKFTLNSMAVDYDYFKTLDISILQGRDFSKDYVDDSSRSVVLNQSAVQALQLNDPIGKRVKLCDSLYYNIIGVSKDYFHNGFSERISPVAYTMTSPCGSTQRPSILLKIGTGNISTVLKQINELWTTLQPLDPQLRYSFLDEDYEKLFVQSERLSSVFRLVSYLSLLISLMGLFGLSSYILSQRKRELSIRKVLGASVLDIFLLINKSFIKLILISTLFACIFSYIFVKGWLSDYAYQTTINTGVFVIVTFLILFLTVFTVTAQSYKTIGEKPVKNLSSD